jgi:hypothetical protein
MIPSTAAPEPEVRPMDALFALSTIALGLIILAATSVSFGVDSRDGFAGDQLRRSFR